VDRVQSLARVTTNLLGRSCHVIHVPLDRIIVEVSELESNLAKYPRVALCLETENMVDLLSGYGTDCDQEISDSVCHCVPPGPVIDLVSTLSHLTIRAKRAGIGIAERDLWDMIRGHDETLLVHVLGLLEPCRADFQQDRHQEDEP
jgi:hypothetical protein